MRAPAVSEQLHRRWRKPAGATDPRTRAGRSNFPTPSKLTALDKVVRDLLGSGKGPAVTFVYHDEETREWATEAYRRMGKAAGDEGLRATWWKISELAAPGILAGAVSSAVRAEVIVVATRAEGLPLPFYVWVNLWWPHRSETPGTLVALLGTPEHAACGLGSVAEYLPIVAHQARMNFLRFEKFVRRAKPRERVPSFSLVNGVESLVHTRAINGHSRRRR